MWRPSPWLLVATLPLAFAAGAAASLVGRERHPWRVFDASLAAAYSGRVAGVAIGASGDAAAARAVQRHIARLDEVEQRAAPQERRALATDKLVAFVELAALVECAPGAPGDATARAVVECQLRALPTCSAEAICDYGRRIVRGLRGGR